VSLHWGVTLASAPSGIRGHLREDRSSAEHKAWCLSFHMCQPWAISNRQADLLLPKVGVTSHLQSSFIPLSVSGEYQQPPSLWPEEGTGAGSRSPDRSDCKAAVLEERWGNGTPKSKVSGPFHGRALGWAAACAHARKPELRTGETGVL
jgi:hypothetical protein